MLQKPIYRLLPICLSIVYMVSAVPAHSQCTNILENPSFESPTRTTLGDSVTTSYTLLPGWTLTGGPVNLIRVDGSFYYAGPNNAADGNQYLDIANAGGTVYQDFTISGTSPMPVLYGGSFSSREYEPGYVNWTGQVQIYAEPADTIVSSSSIVSFTNIYGSKPLQNTWQAVSGSATLTPGNYRYVASYGDYGNFDAAYVSVGCTLPITLYSFTGRLSDNTVLLQWAISNQSQVKEFQVQKSADDRSFTTIAVVPPQTGDQYNFPDHGIDSAGVVFYRILTLSNDGQVNYSQIISIRTMDVTDFVIEPNPVSTCARISGVVSGGWVCIMDAAGRQLMKKALISSNQSLDFSNLRQGVYVVEYFDGKRIQAKEIIVQSK